MQTNSTLYSVYNYMKSPICVLKFVFINVFIIVSEKTVLEGGVWGPPPENFLVIFIQNGAILDNTYGYICLDIMPQKEGRYKPF